MVGYLGVGGETAFNQGRQVEPTALAERHRAFVIASENQLLP
jgi:hypothetical protein